MSRLDGEARKERLEKQNITKLYYSICHMHYYTVGKKKQGDKGNPVKLISGWGCKLLTFDVDSMQDHQLTNTELKRATNSGQLRTIDNFCFPSVSLNRLIHYTEIVVAGSCGKLLMSVARAHSSLQHLPHVFRTVDHVRTSDVKRQNPKETSVSTSVPWGL